MEQEYLTFVLSGEEFGVDILCVQEIRVLSTVTELPNKPDYLKGVINLRGVIIPIVDLRQRFGLEPLSYDDKTVTIILRSRNPEKPMVVGIIVDAVSEVYKFDPTNVRKPPALGSKLDSSFLKGLATVEEKLIILLDTATLLNEDELFSVDMDETPVLTMS
ncbi:chemotaxis protein CheW [Thalassotalea euphylliae]|uniref:Chemotaxis protein CheW n=1 Tax=Thalassotalea euphylliae TaxID=1655234 RepID=A0A3E0UGM1_9GAMM|nr:chemotaxis protein CheW [Thalassotalea euphylliae]REL29774.1 chemotaxis protein CheW [Thalassotalea euphylliae]REL35315.1 chemotaxis protein CheW [Thalassotalea euphylliae]